MEALLERLTEEQQNYHGSQGGVGTRGRSSSQPLGPSHRQNYAHARTSNGYQFAAPAQTGYREMNHQANGLLPVGKQQAYNVAVQRQTSRYNSGVSALLDPNTEGPNFVPRELQIAQPTAPRNTWPSSEPATPRHYSEPRSQSTVPKN